MLHSHELRASDLPNGQQPTGDPSNYSERRQIDDPPPTRGYRRRRPQRQPPPDYNRQLE